MILLQAALANEFASGWVLFIDGKRFRVSPYTIAAASIAVGASLLPSSRSFPGRVSPAVPFYQFQGSPDSVATSQNYLGGTLPLPIVLVG